MRGGGNLAPVQFESDWDYASQGFLYNTALNIVNPHRRSTAPARRDGAFMPQGRYTNTYQFNDNAIAP